jgi:hypothetical protein
VSTINLRVVYVVGNLVWVITEVVLCRKSTNLSWEGEEPSAAAGEEDRLPAVEESASLPQAESVAPVVESTPQEATMVEGMCTAPTLAALCSSHSPRILTSCAL